MRVFVTGATGFVGSAVVNELIAHGHQVLGLARSDAGAAAVAAAGAEIHRGSLEDPESLKAGAAKADAVAHLAFNHDFSRFEANCAEDRRAILAMAEVLEGSDRPMLVTSGLALLRKGGVATEADAPSGDFPRQTEAAAAEAQARGVKAGVVRLAPSTHGAGDHGFVPRLIAIARERGASAYIGEGANRWPAVHRHDAARLYRLALEQGAEGGPFHAIAEEGLPFITIAQAIGKGLGLPVVSVSAEHFGWFAMFAAIDAATSADRTKATLGWRPTEPTLLEDMAASYF